MLDNNFVNNYQNLTKLLFFSLNDKIVVFLDDNLAKDFQNFTNFYFLHLVIKQMSLANDFKT